VREKDSTFPPSSERGNDDPPKSNGKIMGRGLRKKEKKGFIPQKSAEVNTLGNVGRKNSVGGNHYGKHIRRGGKIPCSLKTSRRNKLSAKKDRGVPTPREGCSLDNRPHLPLPRRRTRSRGRSKKKRKKKKKVKEKLGEPPRKISTLEKNQKKKTESQ